VGDKTTVVSTSTRNFPNRLGKGANVYLNFDQLPEYTEKSDKVEIENWPTLMAELRAAKKANA
jgi:aconitate hydratase 2/2-methylisocitrate dehydratase